MANESTYALISALLNPIWEGALFYAEHMFVMPRLVTTFTDMTGMVDRKTSLYVETGVTDNLGETDDLTPVEFDRNLYRTITPKEIGKQFFITDRRVESDVENVVADASRDIGYTMGKKLELDLLGQFADFTGGIFGSENIEFGQNHLFAARTRLEAEAVPGPYVAVIHPFQWFDILKSMTSLTNAAPLDVRNQAQSSFFVERLGGILVVVSSLVPKVSVQNEIQQIVFGGTPTGGTFTLTFAEQTTSALDFDATNAEIEAALEALPNIGTGNVAVTSAGTLPDDTVTFTFQGDLAGENVPELVANIGGLTGGTPTATESTVQDGKNYARGALFTRDALALDLRRGLRIEPERDASLRGTELNATMIYAASEWRAERGVILKSDATAPLE